jgi:hypothetical protein
MEGLHVYDKRTYTARLNAVAKLICDSIANGEYIDECIRICKEALGKE